MAVTTWSRAKEDQTAKASAEAATASSPPPPAAQVQPPSASAGATRQPPSSEFTGNERVTTPPMERKTLVKLQEDDPDCEQLRQAVRQGTQLPQWAKMHSFCLSDDGVLERVSVNRQGKEDRKIVLPKCLVKSVSRGSTSKRCRTQCGGEEGPTDPPIQVTSRRKSHTGEG